MSEVKDCKTHEKCINYGLLYGSSIILLIKKWIENLTNSHIISLDIANKTVWVFFFFKLILETDGLTMFFMNRKVSKIHKCYLWKSPKHHFFMKKKSLRARWKGSGSVSYIVDSMIDWKCCMGHHTEGG